MILNANIYESGGGGDVNPTAEDNDVIFIDYDGTIRYSYSASEFANLSSLPDNPTHEGLTAQGWNWTLADAKTYVSNYGMLTIGQTYITSDGNTKIYINIPKGSLAKDMAIALRLLNDNTGTVIMWGDGTQTSVSASAGTYTYTHNYAECGEYLITITAPAENTYIELYGDINTSGTSGSTITGDYNTYRYRCHWVERVYIGANIKTILDGAFYNMGHLKEITIPNGVEVSGMFAVSYSYWLQGLVVPNTDHTYMLGRSAFRGNQSLRYLSLPKNATNSTESTFRNLNGISRLEIPVYTGGGIGSYGLAYLSTCSSVILPFAQTLDIYAFYYCTSLTKLVLPASLISIGSYALSGLLGLKELYVLRTTPPTVATNAFNDTINFTVYVPAEAVSAYRAASTWSSLNIQAIPT